MKIHIPFLPEFRDAMLGGRKRATARAKRYGTAGDTFEAFGATFRLTLVERVRLMEVTRNWQWEGCESEGEFMSIWSRLHPTGWHADKKVWWHWFERRSDDK